MTRLALLVGAALAAAACSTTTPSPSPSGLTDVASPTTGAPSSPALTARPTPTPVPPGAGLCPTDAVITPFDFVESDPACFVGKEIEIRGWLDVPPGIGFEAPGIEPGWIYYPTVDMSTLWDAQPIGPDQDCQVDGRGCTWFFLHVDPASGPAFEPLPRWVIAKGHIEDPAAETCHYIYPDDWTEGRSDDADAVAACRTQFVLVAIRDAP